MHVEINTIINTYLAARVTGVVSYLFQAPTASGTYVTLNEISDTPTNDKDNDLKLNLQSKARLQLSIFSESHTTVNTLKKTLIRCINTTKDEEEGTVTWIYSQHNFSESIYNKGTNRYQAVIDFFLDYRQTGTT